MEKVYIDEILDFSLVGVLSPIAQILAKSKIGIFVVSTFDTDYIFVKECFFDKAINSLRQNGYTFS